MTTRARIDASREARLWIAQVVAPVCGLVCAAVAIPEVRQVVAAKAEEFRWRSKNKIESLKEKLKKD